MRVRQLLLQVITIVFLGLLGLFVLSPIYFLVINSLKPFSEIVTSFTALPKALTFDNYPMVWERMHYEITFLNTAYLALGSAVVTIIFGAMAGYRLQRSNNRLSRFLLLFIICGLIIPFQVIMVPMTQMMTQILQLNNNLHALIFLYAGLYMPTSVFIFHGFSKTIPRELDEVAMIDGSGPFRTFFQIIFPLLAPAISTMAVFTVVWTWNDLLVAMLMIDDQAYMTLTRRQAAFIGYYSGSEWDFFVTSLFMSSLPIMIFYACLQKYVQKGLVSGAVKG